jgi:hypothetical protein
MFFLSRRISVGRNFIARPAAAGLIECAGPGLFIYGSPRRPFAARGGRRQMIARGILRGSNFPHPIFFHKHTGLENS